ncbi:MAG: glycerol kinase GlpK [Bacteroidota bacterium]
MQKYILSLDQGTTSSRAILFNQNAEIVGVKQKEFTQIFPKPGWVEHNANEIWESQRSVIQEVLEANNITNDDIHAIGITNQRETVVAWDKKTGAPICNAIVWQDRRTSQYCDSLKEEYTSIIKEKTGLIIDAYFSATKIKWILDNVEKAKVLADKEQLCCGTIDSYLVWKLSKGNTFVTDVSNASRTMLFNIKTLTWDEDLLQLFSIPKHVLPTVASSSEVYDSATIETLDGVPISGIAGDQQASLFGHLCTEKGAAKNTYGTGCFMLLNTGEQPIASEHNLLTTIAWQINNKTYYALEGSVFSGGATVQWLRDELQMINSAPEIEALAQQVDDNGGVMFVPAFTGLGAPYWNQDARGTIIGLTRGTQKAHIARAALEGIALQVYDLAIAMKKDAKTEKFVLKVDGGAAMNNFLMQLQSDLLECDVIRPKDLETTALGAAYLAGLATNYWNSLEDLKLHNNKSKAFTPNSTTNEAQQELIRKWHKAVKRSLDWND